jgi:nitroimidazol reductase NimA-like FMN-containing flavoprotein (pyridoxamine 5'-phosphate oxidase superfamily)
MKPNDIARSILDRIFYATLSTVDPNGNPWNSPVYCAYDQNYNVYWGSHIESQHSQNIHANHKVFIVVYDSTVAPGDGEGVYIQAHVEEITDPAEIAVVHKLLQDRRPTWYWTLEQLQPNRPVHLFRAIPDHIWMNGEGEKDGQYIDVREEAQS